MTNSTHLHRQLFDFLRQYIRQQQVDPHWRRGICYLKIGLRWLKGVFHKGRELLTPVPLLPQDPQPVFASKRTERDFYDQIWVSRIRSLTCHS
jgi:hypothetical protein